MLFISPHTHSFWRCYVQVLALNSFRSKDCFKKGGDYLFLCAFMMFKLYCNRRYNFLLYRRLPLAQLLVNFLSSGPPACLAAQSGWDSSPQSLHLHGRFPPMRRKSQRFCTRSAAAGPPCRQAVCWVSEIPFPWPSPKQPGRDRFAPVWGVPCGWPFQFSCRWCWATQSLRWHRPGADRGSLPCVGIHDNDAACTDRSLVVEVFHERFMVLTPWSSGADEAKLLIQDALFCSNKRQFRCASSILRTRRYSVVPVVTGHPDVLLLSCWDALRIAVSTISRVILLAATPLL